MRDPERSHSLSRRAPHVTRRRLVGMTSAALAAPLAPMIARAQQDEGAGRPAPASSIASPGTSIPIDSETLLAVSTALVGVDSLNAGYVEPLAKLIGADPALAVGFDELAQVADLAAAGSLDGLSDAASATATGILTHWYLGQFEGQPVENRAEMFFGLPVWGTVPHATQPTLTIAALALRAAEQIASDLGLTIEASTLAAPVATLAS